MRRAGKLAQMGLKRDNIFRDSLKSQMYTSEASGSWLVAISAKGFLGVYY